jgi:hypothetical protein
LYSTSATTTTIACRIDHPQRTAAHRRHQHRSQPASTASQVGSRRRQQPPGGRPSTSCSAALSYSPPPPPATPTTCHRLLGQQQPPSQPLLPRLRSAATALLTSAMPSTTGVLLLTAVSLALGAAAADRSGQQQETQEWRSSDAWLLSDSDGHLLPPPPSVSGTPGPSLRKNVLHIVVDDLRPVMKLAYRAGYMVTPNFDRLASQSLVFSRAFCQIAVCAPSRSSFMSGVRPDVTAIFNFANNIRDPGLSHITTLPGQFLAQNYTVLGGGKTLYVTSSYDYLCYVGTTLTRPCTS